MQVLGTAGHVDHGKSSLVRALSGIDPDRLPEEKARGLTIELGFAWFETAVGPLGVVDVPGHERFVRTMIAGAGGIDIVLLVVAADDGWMPQTQEHLEIVRLLNVRTGVIALSKVDLVDTAWRELVTDDIREKTRGTFLEGAPIVPTAAQDGVGLEELRAAIAAAQKCVTEAEDCGRPRLAIDRVFTMPGQGTVVTGTLRDGRLKLDQSVFIFPGEKTARLRGLQTHKQMLGEARPGSRVAANVAGIDKVDLHRGHWLLGEEPGVSPRFMGVELEILANVPFALKPGTQLLVIFGTSEIPARLVTPDSRPLTAGSKRVAQLDLRGPVPARFGDRFIVRLPSPQVTVGGGRFLYPCARRFGATARRDWEGLATIAEGDVTDWIALHLATAGVETVQRLYPFFPGRREALESVLSAGHESVKWWFKGEFVWDRAELERKKKSIAFRVLAFHREFPAQTGPSKAEIFNAEAIPDEQQGMILEELRAHGIGSGGPSLRHESHRAGLTDAQEALADRWRALFAAKRFGGPLRSELLAESSEAQTTLEFLLKSGELLELKDGVLLRKSDFASAARLALTAIAKDGALTVARFRDLIGTTRKYALPILDRCDREGYTRREGDERVRGPHAAELLGREES